MEYLPTVALPARVEQVDVPRAAEDEAVISGALSCPKLRARRMNSHAELIVAGVPGVA